MKTDELQKFSDIKFVMPSNVYNPKVDNRLLIPFISKDKIGFMNHNYEVVLEPQFVMYDGVCYSTNDYIRVAINQVYGFPRANNQVSVYCNPRYGVINSEGVFILPPSI